MDSAGVARGHALFDVATGKVRWLDEDSDSEDVAWLPDYRHVVYFGPRGRLVMQDIESLARREIAGALPYPAADGLLTAAPDGRMLYYGAQQVEANIWMVRRPVRTTAAR